MPGPKPGALPLGDAPLFRNYNTIMDACIYFLYYSMLGTSSLLSMRILVLSFVAVLLVGCSTSTPNTPAGGSIIEPEPPVKEGQKTEKTETGLQKLITFYSATICAMADPSFWDGFWDDNDENGWTDTSTPEGKAKADAEAQQYYRNFGYESEAEIAAELEVYRGRSALIEGVSLTVEELCPGSLSESDMEEILEGMK